MTKWKHSQFVCVVLKETFYGALAEFGRSFQPITKPDNYGLRRAKQGLRVPVLSAPHENFIEIQSCTKQNETVIIGHAYNATSLE